MKNFLVKYYFLIFLLLFFLCFLFPSKIFAYQQTEAVCYSQCAAYKFGWKGDFCWDLFQDQCSIGSKDALSNFISLVKDTAQAMVTGKLKTIVDVKQVFKAWFVCKPLIEDCIVPQLDACENICKNDSQTVYAPNLSVGNPYGSAAFHNVYYDEANHQLIFKVVNNGYGYAWDIDVSASWGHTRNRDKLVSGGGTLFTEKIPELLFLGARVGSPKTPGDIVIDFLIDESNISGFLSSFKSDANNHYVPPAWYKSVPFTAPDGEYTKVILNVDPNQMIPESNELDNTYILEIDKLPTPASLSIQNLTYKRSNSNDLRDYIVSFELKNSGEENGSAHIKWYEGSYETGKNPIKEQNMVIQALNKAAFDNILTVDVSSGSDSCNLSQKYTIVVFDDEGFIKTTQEFYLPQFAGSINGLVEDLFGKKVVDATITASTGQSAIVNDMGFYHIKGIPTLGKITLTATHPDFSQPVSKEVEIKFDDSQDKCHITGLTHNGVDFVLKDQDVLFTVTIKDNSGNLVNAQVLVTSEAWRFNETVNGTGPLPGMQPGKYVFTITAPGFKTISQDINAVPNEQNLEFTLEKLNGRPTDGGLTIFTSSQFLWQKELDKEIFVQMTATKDGKEVIFYTTRNKENSGKLYFVDSLTGNEIKIIGSTIATKGQAQSCLDTSYDGNTTALYVHTGSVGIAQNTRNVLKLFNNQGSEIDTTDFKSGGGAHECDVSPDGFYVFPDRL
ncbi:carboxypeptidase regulatory-like domain-containing protein, partial [Candidatus Beckwithbacteria bacterium]|nr:carboxypeptidase regulatory-like domain-containing protein [Candidatus Beckwithbacteria bacterium]